MNNFYLLKFKFFLLISATIILCAVVNCSCSQHEGIHIDNSATGKCRGTVTVVNGDGEGKNFVKENIEAEILCTDSVNNLYNLYLYKVSFSSRMPVNINMTIPNVTINQQGIILGDNIVPLAGILGEYEKYRIHNLKGQITFSEQGKPQTLVFDMLCGSYPTSYEGVYY